MPERDPWLGPIGRRLAAAFTGVALLAVGVVVALVIVSIARETSSLAERERDAAARSAAVALEAAYRQAGGWEAADVRAAQRIARDAGGRLVVRDAAGAVVAGPGPGGGAGPGAGAGSGPAGVGSSAPVVAGGEVVGTAEVRVPGSGLTRSEAQLRDRMVTIAIVAAALAVLLALVAAVLVARRLSRPLRRLTHATRSLEAGEAGARARIASAPGELGELGRAFDGMADSLEQQAIARRTLLAEVAHELRTPLSVLRASTEALVDGVEPATTERLVELRDEVGRLERLVTDLETLAEADSAFVRLEREPVDLAELVGARLARLAGRAHDEGVSLEPALAPAVVDADPQRLGQVVDNLLGNALKFTPQGGSVRVTTGRRGEHAVLEVADTGPGIPAHELAHVFDRYWRGQAAVDVSGRGIGLAVVDELARAHGGRVEAASPPGEGARFTLAIPAA
jgi:two-component system sensor histidine kinase BaeS